MLRLIKRTNEELNIDIEELDLGGGLEYIIKRGMNLKNRRVLQNYIR